MFLEIIVVTPEAYFRVGVPRVDGHAVKKFLYQRILDDRNIENGKLTTIFVVQI